MSYNGEIVIPPYQEGFVEDDTVSVLLTRNVISELEHAQYILHLSGIFSQYFNQKQIDPSDLLNGKAMSYLPKELQSHLIQMHGQINAPDQMEKETIGDFLVVYTLHVLDHAREVRMLWKVFH